jgi:hypothetical protein
MDVQVLIANNRSVAGNARSDGFNTAFYEILASGGKPSVGGGAIREHQAIVIVRR